MMNLLKINNEMQFNDSAQVTFKSEYKPENF